MKVEISVNLPPDDAGILMSAKI